MCEAVYYAVKVRRLRPEDQDVLVEFPRVERVVQRVSRVRPPHGFGLSKARHQARKVHMLHTMLKVSQEWECTGQRHNAEGCLYIFYHHSVNIFQGQCLTAEYVTFIFSEFPGLHVFPPRRFASQLFWLDQRRSQPETAHAAATSPAHTRVPQHQQVRTHANVLILWYVLLRCGKC